MIQYLDISEHQGTVDWDRLKSQTDGVILRAGRGAGIPDVQWERNITEANRTGVPVGVYWFTQARTVEMVQQEAAHCLKAISGHKIQLPVAFDFEEYTITYYMKNKGVEPTKRLCTDMAKAFLSAIEAAGYYAMLYTGLNFSTNYYYMDELAAYDVWWAQYPVKVDLSKPPRKCGIWQWGGSTVEGITTGSVDTNVSYNDYESIIAKAGLNHLNDEPKAWYTDAMAWAAENGILDGTRPEDPVTRAEVAQMFFNYVNARGE